MKTDTFKTGRNILLIGIVLGLGAAAGGYYMYELPEPESLNVPMPEAKVKDNGLADEASQVVQNVATKRRLVDEAPGLDVAFVPRDKVKGKKIPRYTPLFFPPTIWEVPDASQKKNIAVDLLAVDGSHPLHTVTAADGETKSVPNTWFYMYGLERNICDADVMQQDPDGDGFTNAEEFSEGKDPSDAASMPSFVAGGTVKLECVGRKTVHHYRIELSVGSSFADNVATIVILNDKGERVRRHESVKPGTKFGLGEEEGGVLGRERFTLEKIDTLTDESGIESHVVRIRDGYTRRDGAAEFDVKEGSRARRDIQDTLVKLRVTAGPKKGKPEAEFTVQLGETFEIPGFTNVQCQFIDAGSKKTPAKVKVNGKEEYILPSTSSQTPKKSK